jgi:N-methylhydantoinase B
MTVAYCGDGGTFPARGVLGGGDGAPSGSWKRHANGSIEKLPAFHEEKVRAHEAIHYQSCAGGGYGDPRKRDPQRVAADVNKRWLKAETAERVFGVAVKPADNGVDCVVDADRTRTLRAPA